MVLRAGTLPPDPDIIQFGGMTPRSLSVARNTPGGYATASAQYERRRAADQAP